MKDNIKTKRIIKKKITYTEGWALIKALEKTEKGRVGMERFRTHYDGLGAELTRFAHGKTICK